MRWNCGSHQRRLGQRKLWILSKILDSLIDRYQENESIGCQKYEYVFKVELTDAQREFYAACLQAAGVYSNTDNRSSLAMFDLFYSLKLLLFHPLALVSALKRNVAFDVSASESDDLELFTQFQGHSGKPVPSSSEFKIENNLSSPNVTKELEIPFGQKLSTGAFRTLLQDEVKGLCERFDGKSYFVF